MSDEVPNRWTIGQPVGPESNDPPKTTQYEKAEAREKEKWREMINDWDKVTPKTLERRVRRGIPDDMREDIWTSYLNNGLKDKLEEEIKEKLPKGFNANIEALKREIIGVAINGDQQVTAEGIKLATLCGIYSQTIKQIQADLNRVSLREEGDTSKDMVLKYNNWLDIALWYAAISPEFGGNDHGYLQNFGSIITVLLKYFKKTTELRYLFYYVITTRHYREIIDTDFYMTPFVNVFKNIAERHIGELWNHMFSFLNDLFSNDPTGATRQLLTLMKLQTIFVLSDNYPFIMHLFDLYMYAKDPIILLYRISMSMINSVRHDTMECYSYEDWRDNIYPRITMINPHKIIHDAFIFNISKKERDMYIDMLIKEINQASFEKDERAKEGAAITATRESKAKWDARKKALIARKDSMVIWLKESARNPFSRADASGEHVEEENEGDADEGDEDEGDEDEDEGAQRVSMSSSSSNGSTSSTVEMG
jgi:hypothetical protein